MKILMVLTSHENLDNTGLKTGLWLEDFVAPYYVFKDAGAEITLASPFGRQPPVDPRSEDVASQTHATRRFEADAVAKAALSRTMKLRDVVPALFDAVFYPGGHGPLWDLAENAYSISLIETMLAAGKPVAAVCQASGVLRHVKSADGKPVVCGRAVTGFANTEEQSIGLTRVVPFLVEEMLTRSGGLFSKADDWQPHVVVDGLLITGQNPASSELAARALLQAIRVPDFGVRGRADALN
ncbi:MAG: type 1 glutamine amidotransferase domain-containing protein [Burkholderiales bacterium]